MIAPVAVLALVAGGGVVEDSVRQALARGEYLEALARARALPDARDRRAAEVLVHYHGGDLRGARALASSGLELHPGDRELALDLAEIAATLRDLPEAERGTEALARALAAAPPAEAERARWAEALAARRAAVRTLAERRAASRGALLRARWLVGVAGVLALAALVWLARPAPARAPHAAGG